MNEWQKGFDLDHLKFLESYYTGWNARIRSPFAKFKKHHIADALSKKEFILVHHPQFYNIICSYTVKRAKVASNIIMHGDTVIGRKETGDIIIENMVGDPFLFMKELEQYEHENCWLVIQAGSYKDREIAQATGFEYVGVKINTFSDMFAFFFRNADMAFAPRKHPVVAASEKVSMKRIMEVNPYSIWKILEELKTHNPTFMNHYSNYNKDNAWSALSLRGYSADPLFIEKPEEMNDAWKAKHKGEEFVLQDTPLYEHFPAVRSLIEYLNTPPHRIRFMKLAPGGGELERHTDQVDPDAGSTVGKLARLHFPIQTNPNVIFTTWDEYDQEVQHHFSFGECWYLDTRKPHMAVNNGTEERIHLVVDVEVNPTFQQMIGRP